METELTIQILRSTIGNPISRNILHKISCYCETCKKNRTDVALELFTGARKHACLKCKIAEKALSGILLMGGKTFGVGNGQLREQFSNPSWRKALSLVLKGIADFGVTKPFVTAAPFLVVWDVTYACNLKCKHCYANAGQKLTDELTTEEAKKVIDILDQSSVPIISFSGGEPLVRPDIFELTRYAADKGIYVAVATNGTLITQEKAIEMKKADIQFTQISLDGATAKTHDTFRGINGVFKKTIKGIQNAVEEGFFVNVATTATKDNYKEIPNIIDLCEKLKVEWFMMYNFVPTGRGKFISNNDLGPSEREQLLKELWHKLQDGSNTVNMLSTAPQFARIALQQEKGEHDKTIPTHFYNPTFTDKLTNLAEFIGGCGCGRVYCAIRPNGNIDPCVFFPLTIGNILTDDFTDIWKTNPILTDLRDRDKLRDSCGTCTYKYYCGGCRARAYAYNQDYLAGDIGCINNNKKKVCEYS